jgi:GTP cyclohydrolase I
MDLFQKPLSLNAVGGFRSKDADVRPDLAFQGYSQLLESTLPKKHWSASLEKTPLRAASAWRQMTQGYHENVADLANDAVFETQNCGLVVVRDVEFFSVCEHHLMPFFGVCHVAYLPNGKVLGLSKIPRIIDCFSRRLQIQETLTWQIGDGLMQILRAKAVSVVMQGQHMCMMMRGVQKQKASLLTQAHFGAFQDAGHADYGQRAEFLASLR